jgi:TP53 regulating kinase-like protein
VDRTKTGVRKSRPVKAYRHAVLDTLLRTQRTRAEARNLEKAKRAGVTVPDVIILDDTTLDLTLAPGVPLKETLDKDPTLLKMIGTMLAKLHAAGIIHGDLTTSNIMHDQKSGTLTFIDFGLSFHSERIEDRAVDIHVLKQALASKHHTVAASAFRSFTTGYRTKNKDAMAVMERLRAVERRGRNKVT